LHAFLISACILYASPISSSLISSF
jgi:hypothetical protein